MSDTGLADPRLAAALAAHRDRPSAATRTEVLAAFAGARVFAPITAVSTAEHVDPGTGLRAESTAEMALLTLVGSAGGRAVPLFLDAGGAVAFREGARPVPLRGPEACRAALDDGAVAVLLDPPGASFPVTGAELVELAAGRVPVGGAPLSAQVTDAPLTDPADVPPETLQVLADALRDEPVRAARLVAHPDGLLLGVVPTGELDVAALTALAGRVLPHAPGLALAVVPEHGPGVTVPLRRRRGLLRRGR